MDTKALRQKILHLAIRGKLVPQDPNDEPASVLLERIRTEKERLIAEGKIKRPQKAKSSSSEYHYQKFEIPASWEWTTLGEIIKLYSGQDFVPEKYNDEKNGIPYIIGASNIQDGNIIVTRWTEYPSVISEYGDLLIVCKGAGVGKMVINNVGKCHIARQIQAIRVYGNTILLDYIQLVLQKGISYVVSQANGLIPGLPRDLLLNFPIPLPPIQEQKRISKTFLNFDATLKCIEQFGSTLSTSIKTIKSKILELAMQGKLVPQDPADEPAADLLRRVNPKARIITDNPHYPQLPDNWALSTIKDVFIINPKNKVDNSTLAGFVPMASIDDGYSNSFTFVTKEWGAIKSGFTHFADGDIAVAKISPCLENRKSMVVKGLPNGIGSGTTELLVFRSDARIPEYGLLFFKSDNFIKKCVSTYNGVVGQQRVGKGIVEEIALPIPPVNEQKKIVGVVKYLFNVLENIRVSLD